MQTADYIEAASRRATFEKLEDGTVYAEIPVDGLEGVWVNSDTEEEAARELAGVLEDWILLRVSKGLPVPTIEGHTVEIPCRESLEALAQEQGVSPAGFEKLSGEFWPEDEDPQEFIAALTRWRSDSPETRDRPA